MDLLTAEQVRQIAKAKRLEKNGLPMLISEILEAANDGEQSFTKDIAGDYWLSGDELEERLEAFRELGYEVEKLYDNCYRSLGIKITW